MKKMIALMLVILPTYLMAQQKYYWNGNKKELLEEDLSSSVIYENPTNGYEVSKSNTMDTIIRHSDKYNGKYNIVRYKGKTTKSSNINNSKIRSSSYALKNSKNDTLWLSHFIVLRLKAQFNINELTTILNQNNATIKGTEYGVVRIEVQNIDNVINTANLLYETGKVFWCQPDFLITVQRTLLPWQKQYYLKNYYYSHCGVDHDINAVEAWNITKGCSNITVAVIDDGVENHPALNDEYGNSRVLNGFTPSGTTMYGRPDAEDKHGQACAGIIAASHNDDIHGIAPNVKILPVKVRFGYGIPTSEYASAIRWAWNNGADVLSNSWGGGNDANIIDAIDSAQIFGRKGLGAIVVFSSGNDGYSYVDTYANVSIAVGAIDKNDTPAKGLRGDRDIRYTNIGTGLDLVAYGGSIDKNNGNTDIRTIDRTGDNGYNSGDYTDTFGGTSAACPQVSGAAALILSINPNLTRQQVENILFSTATDLGAAGRDDTYGYGKLNIFAALQATIRTLGRNFYVNEGYLSYSKTRDNTRITFLDKPDCGIASGVYSCDVYKAETSIPYVSPWFWYLGEGL